MLGRLASCAQTVAMKASVFLSVLAGLAAGQVKLPRHNLPELFSYDHGSHSVAVYRGAALKAAIAAGLVKGFPGSGASAGAGNDGRSGRQFVAPTPRPTLPPTPAPTRPPPPPPTPAPVCGCSQKRLHQELDNMRKQMAALQKAMNTIAPLVMDIPMCA